MQHHAIAYTADSLGSASIDAHLRIPSADVRHFVGESFSMSDARSLAREAETRPVSAEYKEFVIVAHKIAIDAQNALLKLFEEPPSAVRFHLITPASVTLLPTLRSRLSFQVVHDQNIDKENDAFTSFVRSPYEQRMTLIAEKAKEKDLQWMEQIVQGSETLSRTSYELLPAILFVRRYMGYKGASMKMLLEHIALLLPVK